MKRNLLLLSMVSLISMNAWAQRPLKTRATLDGFYTLSMSKMLDTIIFQTKLRIIYDPEMIKEYSVVEHYFNENVADALARMCKDNKLYYWVDPDQRIYIIRKTEDVSRLKKMVSEVRELNTTPGKVPDVRPKSVPDPKAASVALTNPGPVKTAFFTITGRVIDHVSGESLPAAIVRVRNTNLVTSTNTDGYFTLMKVPSDTCVLTIHYIGYQPDVYSLNADNIKKEILVSMFSSVKSLDEVVIADRKKESLMSTDKRRVSVLQISPSKLEELPNIGEKDILRAFQLMPGISASNESSSGAYVRGGTPDQNLVLFDGFTVYQVDHLYGFFSAFNSNAVKDVTLYKGGFSAKYGGRLSSVTDIVGKEGNNKETSITSDLSLLSANVFLEKPISSKSTVLLAYRHSYQGPLYNKIFNQFNTSTSVASGGGGRPGGGGPPGGGGGGFGGASSVSTPSSSFYDFNAKYTYAPDDRNRFSWSLYQGNDNLDNSREITLPSFVSNSGTIKMTDKTTYGNLGSSLKWSRRWSQKLYANTLLSYSTYHSDRDNTNTLTIEDNAGGDDQEVATGTLEKNSLKDFSLKSDWEWQTASKFKFLFGGFASSQDVSYENSLNDTSTLISQHVKALTAGGYAELEMDPTRNLQIKPSLRSTFYDQTGKVYLEPRMTATYTLTDRLTLKGSTGKFYQFTNRVIKEDILSGSRDFWVLSNGSTIPVSSANHYIAGFSYETDQFLFDVEGYYKTLDNLSEYSQRQSGRGMMGSGGTLEEYFYSGTGYTKGLEFLVQKTHGKYTGWISYTLGKAVNNFEVYDGEFPASQDTRHEFKSINLYHYGKWTFAATWIYASGKPYTAPITSYSIDGLSGTRRTFLTISGKNQERMPSYNRLDVSATYDLIKIDRRKVGSLGFSLFNVYNRSNTWYRQYSIVNNQVVTSDVNYLGLTPNITLTLKWK
ncbi:TonB-dependent receptor [Pedobacter metabolipauper]|uniref:Outer membrane receptor protein involved in Fe transport n=1 Tax=Pedobacter metabolipauper TaxID=425513 RepID=A0A4R6SZH5_9SPHI|nr:TonB-dependent receptor [Pedobacter metabolipauper]TDQ10104.1 outer membrane receptor protein involved in Fe transport [Pedobacter metabolipauper]